jgi:fluoroacetyl-CoA thioesterase
MKEIPVGQTNEMTITTTPEMGIRHLGPAASLYSTPAMVEHIEGTALQSLLPFLGPEEQSVGVRINVAHMAPTPIGMKVTIKTTLQEVDGRRCVFAVEVHNEGGVKIGEGTHERRIIDVSRFTAGAMGQ